MEPDDIEMAKFEIEQLELIIARQDEHTFKFRGWLFVVLGALAVCLYSKTGYIELTAWEFFWLGAFSIVVFAMLELVQRAPARLAINRVKDVERMIRQNTSYDGPLIAETFEPPMYDLRSELKIKLMWMPYVVALAAVVVLSWVKESPSADMIGFVVGLLAIVLMLTFWKPIQAILNAIPVK
ncbi:hypothetical protein Pan216_17380 [Planctomycetes bacterium Pan216]|uniref:Uncharacterized protein n=1 Tax=Kolteria novifilia TaxID=2527975 RepID=A0A518B1M5_9BACT|nr:hypothetical protein Pan216_17380 [Planctomycetes bacterium Pan216]